MTRVNTLRNKFISSKLKINGKRSLDPFVNYTN